MIRRVMAWVLLAGFVLLLLNILMFHYYLEVCILIYLIIAIWFMFTNKPLPSRKKKKATNSTTEEATDETSDEVTEEPIEGSTEESSKKASEENIKE